MKMAVQVTSVFILCLVAGSGIFVDAYPIDEENPLNVVLILTHIPMKDHSLNQNSENDHRWYYNFVENDSSVYFDFPVKKKLKGCSNTNTKNSMPIEWIKTYSQKDEFDSCNFCKDFLRDAVISFNDWVWNKGNIDKAIISKTDFLKSYLEQWRDPFLSHPEGIHTVMRRSISSFGEPEWRESDTTAKLHFSPDQRNALKKVKDLLMNFFLGAFGLGTSNIPKIPEHHKTESLVQMAEETLSDMRGNFGYQKRFVFLISGGEFHNINDKEFSEAAWDLESVVKMFLSNTDPDQTLIVITGLCPDDPEGVPEIPLYSKGPGSVRVGQATVVWQVPYILRGLMADYDRSRHGPAPIFEPNPIIIPPTYVHFPDDLHDLDDDREDDDDGDNEDEATLATKSLRGHNSRSPQLKFGNEAKENSISDINTDSDFMFVENVNTVASKPSLATATSEKKIDINDSFASDLNLSREIFEPGARIEDMNKKTLFDNSTNKYKKIDRDINKTKYEPNSDIFRIYRNIRNENKIFGKPAENAKKENVTGNDSLIYRSSDDSLINSGTKDDLSLKPTNKTNTKIFSSLGTTEAVKTIANQMYGKTVDTMATNSDSRNREAKNETSKSETPFLIPESIYKRSNINSSNSSIFGNTAVFTDALEETTTKTKVIGRVLLGYEPIRKRRSVEKYSSFFDGKNISSEVSVTGTKKSSNDNFSDINTVLNEVSSGDESAEKSVATTPDQKFANPDKTVSNATKKDVPNISSVNNDIARTISTPKDEVNDPASLNETDHFINTYKNIATESDVTEKGVTKADVRDAGCKMENQSCQSNNISQNKFSFTISESVKKHDVNDSGNIVGNKILTRHELPEKTFLSVISRREPTKGNLESSQYHEKLNFSDSKIDMTTSGSKTNYSNRNYSSLHVTQNMPITDYSDKSLETGSAEYKVDSITDKTKRNYDNVNKSDDFHPAGHDCGCKHDHQAGGPIEMPKNSSDLKNSSEGCICKHCGSFSRRNLEGSEITDEEDASQTNAQMGQKYKRNYDNVNKSDDVHPAGHDCGCKHDHQAAGPIETSKNSSDVKNSSEGCICKHCGSFSRRNVEGSEITGEEDASQTNAEVADQNLTINGTNSDDTARVNKKSITDVIAEYWSNVDNLNSEKLKSVQNITSSVTGLETVIIFFPNKIIREMCNDIDYRSVVDTNDTAGGKTNEAVGARTDKNSPGNCSIKYYLRLKENSSEDEIDLSTEGSKNNDFTNRTVVESLLTLVDVTNRTLANARFGVKNEKLNSSTEDSKNKEDLNVAESILTLVDVTNRTLANARSGVKNEKLNSSTENSKNNEDLDVAESILTLVDVTNRTLANARFGVKNEKLNSSTEDSKNNEALDVAESILNVIDLTNRTLANARFGVKNEKLDESVKDSGTKSSVFSQESINNVADYVTTFISYTEITSAPPVTQDKRSVVMSSENGVKNKMVNISQGVSKDNIVKRAIELFTPNIRSKRQIKMSSSLDIDTDNRASNDNNPYKTQTTRPVKETSMDAVKLLVQDVIKTPAVQTTGSVPTKPGDDNFSNEMLVIDEPNFTTFNITENRDSVKDSEEEEALDVNEITPSLRKIKRNNEKVLETKVENLFDSHIEESSPSNFSAEIIEKTDSQPAKTVNPEHDLRSTAESSSYNDKENLTVYNLSSNASFEEFYNVSIRQPEAYPQHKNLTRPENSSDGNVEIYSSKTSPEIFEKDFVLQPTETGDPQTTVENGGININVSHDKIQKKTVPDDFPMSDAANTQLEDKDTLKVTKTYSENTPEVDNKNVSQNMLVRNTGHLLNIGLSAVFEDPNFEKPSETVSTVYKAMYFSENETDQISIEKGENVSSEVIETKILNETNPSEEKKFLEQKNNRTSGLKVFGFGTTKFPTPEFTKDEQKSLLTTQKSSGNKTEIDIKKAVNISDNSAYPEFVFDDRLKELNNIGRKRFDSAYNNAQDNNFDIQYVVVASIGFYLGLTLWKFD